jgi:hypothetical protein
VTGDATSSAARRQSRRLWRAVLVLVATGAGFAVSFVLFRQAVGSDSPWLGLFLMFCVLGMAKMAEPLFALRMPGRLRDLRAWERSRVVQRALGIRAFGRLLRGTPLRYLNASLYLSREPGNVEHVVRLVEAAEASHWWAALVLLPWIGFAAAAGRYVAVMVLLLVQVVWNVYPILHLRLVRSRLLGLLAGRARWGRDRRCIACARAA